MISQPVLAGIAAAMLGVLSSASALAKEAPASVVLAVEEGAADAPCTKLFQGSGTQMRAARCQADGMLYMVFTAPAPVALEAVADASDFDSAVRALKTRKEVAAVDVGQLGGSRSFTARSAEYDLKYPVGWFRIVELPEGMLAAIAVEGEKSLVPAERARRYAAGQAFVDSLELAKK